MSKLSRKSDTTAAIRYALSRWEALVRYGDDGRIEIDNNAADHPITHMEELLPWQIAASLPPTIEPAA